MSALQNLLHSLRESSKFGCLGNGLLFKAYEGMMLAVICLPLRSQDS